MFTVQVTGSVVELPERRVEPDGTSVVTLRLASVDAEGMDAVVVRPHAPEEPDPISEALLTDIQRDELLVVVGEAQGIEPPRRRGGNPAMKITAQDILRPITSTVSAGNTHP